MIKFPGVRVWLTLLSSVLFVNLTSGTALAGPVYTCPNNSSECAGQTFALFIQNSGSGFFDITLSINTAGYTGSENDRAYGVEFKNVISSNDTYSSISVTSAPGGFGSWTAGKKQLSQNCSGGDKQDTGCAVWSGVGNGYNFTIGDILSWTFHVETTSALDFEGGHIKYWYVDPNGKKVAGLLSQDILLQDCRNGKCEDKQAPEPGSLTLLGLGLLAGAARLRSRKSA